MPRRQDERNRVLGPTWIPSRENWRIVVITPSAPDPKKRRVVRYHREESEAVEIAEAARKHLSTLTDTTMEQAIDQYRTYLQEKGTGALSYNETTRRLRLFFPKLQMSINRVTPEMAKKSYEAFRQRKKKNGKVIAVDYHRDALGNVKSFFNWCVEQEWLSANPFAKVKGVGRRNYGKAQHTGDEAGKFYSYCMARARTGDETALACLMALLMALRSSDITRRVVRDVDQNCTVLRVSQGKTAMSNRPRRIPAVLQPALRQLVQGRDVFEPLFYAPRTKDHHHTRHWLEEGMERFCEASGVPYICPHALKGMAGSLLAETGAAADVIADHLSHEHTSTTLRHYVSPGSLEQSRLERALKVLDRERN